MSEERSLLLENQLCFLFYTTARLMGQLYTPLLTPLGITYLQYLVLLLLWEKDNQEVGDLTERLSMDTGTVSPLLKRMERDGLVVRRRDTEDERRVRISLTGAGRALKTKAAAVPEAVFCRSGLTPGEYGELKSALESLLPRLAKKKGNRAERFPPA